MCLTIFGRDLRQLVFISSIHSLSTSLLPITLLPVQLTQVHQHQAGTTAQTMANPRSTMLKARTDQYPSHLLDGNPVSCLALLEKSVIVLHSVFMSFDGLCHMRIFEPPHHTCSIIPVQESSHPAVSLGCVLNSATNL